MDTIVVHKRSAIAVGNIASGGVYGYTVERVVFQRCANGTDYGVERRVLALSATRALWWVGGSSYSDNGGRHYVAASLTSAEYVGGEWGNQRTIFEGGRLSAARFAQHAEEINRRFGASVAAVLRSDRTVLVGEKA
jgi:hypothetical protein